MPERNASAGYIALGKQTTATTAVIPAVYAPYYSQSLATDIHLISDEPVFGNKFKRFQSLQGIRSHGGSLTVMAEPNTAAYWHDMLATKGTTTGANPYTHPYTASNTTEPNSYTLDVANGSWVARYIGVQASKIGYGWDGEKMVLNVDVSGLKSFYGREIATISTTTVTFTTTYDPSPTTGLVANDLVKIVKSDGTTSNFTISSITNGTTVVLNATAASFAAGDMLVLRPATPSLSLLTPFTWPRTEFRFGANATAALSATQTRLDEGTEITLMHEFDEEEGTKRSGDLDPASLPRTVYDLEVKVKTFLDNPDKIKEWNAVSKRALVMRAFAGSTNQYELRVTMNDLRTATNDQPSESAATIYHEFEYYPNYDTADGQAFDVKVINSVATI